MATVMHIFYDNLRMQISGYFKNSYLHLFLPKEKWQEQEKQIKWEEMIEETWDIKCNFLCYRGLHKTNLEN